MGGVNCRCQFGKATSTTIYWQWQEDIHHCISCPVLTGKAHNFISYFNLDHSIRFNESGLKSKAETPTSRPYKGLLVQNMDVLEEHNLGPEMIL